MLIKLILCTSVTCIIILDEFLADEDKIIYNLEKFKGAT